MLTLLAFLQAVQVVILWLHDWLPLPPLNDVAAVRRADTTARLVWITLIQSVPYTIGLIYTIRALQTHLPGWLVWWLWISYGLLFLGALRAWWFPYLVRPEPVRVARATGKCSVPPTPSFLNTMVWSPTHYMRRCMSLRSQPCSYLPQLRFKIPGLLAVGHRENLDGTDRHRCLSAETRA
jgi:hypothetical protein